MKIAITDANIFIDLLHVKLQAELFALELEIHTTAEVFDELNEKQQKSLNKFVKNKTLIIHFQPIDELSRLGDTRRALSDSDKSVLRVAVSLKAILLTGDNVLRKVSHIEKIEVHGVLWLFDRFVEGQIISKANACARLNRLLLYNKRLPFDECEKRLKEWSYIKNK